MEKQSQTKTTYVEDRISLKTSADKGPGTDFGLESMFVPELSRVQGDPSCEHTPKDNSKSALESRALEETQEYRDEIITLTGKRHFHLAPNPSSRASHREGRANPRQPMRREAKRARGRKDGSPSLLGITKPWIRPDREQGED